MLMRYNNKIMLFLCSFVLFALVVTGISLKERKYCMGVPVISEEHLKEYTEIDSLDISQLIFDGQPIAVDWIRKQVYISQSSHALKKFFDLQGKIGSENPEYEIFVLKFVKKMKNTEIAKTLHLNPSTVSTIVQRTIEKIQKEIGCDYE